MGAGLREDIDGGGQILEEEAESNAEASVGEEGGEPAVDSKADRELMPAPLQKNGEEAEDRDDCQKAEFEVLTTAQEIIEVPEIFCPGHGGEENRREHDEDTADEQETPGDAVVRHTAMREELLPTCWHKSLDDRLRTDGWQIFSCLHSLT